MGDKKCTYLKLVVNPTRNKGTYQVLNCSIMLCADSNLSRALTLQRCSPLSSVSTEVIVIFGAQEGNYILGLQ